MINFFSRQKNNITRKEQTEAFLTAKGIKINLHLPHVEGEDETVVRPATEAAIRVTMLTVTNLVAFNTIDAKEAIDYLEHYNLVRYLTPDEKDFLANPTDDRKNQETWKCECIWVLLWYLNIVDDLEFPDHLCDLNTIDQNHYPIHPDRDPNDFIKRDWQARSKAEVLDATDLYYRMNWACVDARINGQSIDIINSDVVYERQYALNWLVNYMNQEWDDISCDT
jgi:hypothetical protein